MMDELRHQLSRLTLKGWIALGIAEIVLWGMVIYIILN